MTASVTETTEANTAPEIKVFLIEIGMTFSTIFPSSVFHLTMRNELRADAVISPFVQRQILQDYVCPVRLFRPDTRSSSAKDLAQGCSYSSFAPFRDDREQIVLVVCPIYQQKV